jgi:hypothetical protein
MVATRENQTIRNQRNSALFVLANARVWASEGWQVTITDADGRQFDAAGFESVVTPAIASAPRTTDVPDLAIPAAE